MGCKESVKSLRMHLTSLQFATEKKAGRNKRGQLARVLSVWHGWVWRRVDLGNLIPAWGVPSFFPLSCMGCNRTSGGRGDEI